MKSHDPIVDERFSGLYATATMNRWFLVDIEPDIQELKQKMFMFVLNFTFTRCVISEKLHIPNDAIHGIERIKRDLNLLIQYQKLFTN